MRRHQPQPHSHPGTAALRRLPWIAAATAWAIAGWATAGWTTPATAEALGPQAPQAETTPVGTPQGPADTPPSPPRDVILITIDTLRADALGFSGNTVVATPILDRLANEGRVFTAAHAHNVVTLPSHANILTGLYPYQHGIRDNEGYRLADDIPTLATRLQRRGFATGAFVSAYPLDASFGLDRGFDVYDDDFPKGGDPSGFTMAERRGDRAVARAVAWWNGTPAPRFLWLHLYDPHAPYDPPPPFAERFAATPYLGEVAATDHYLAPLLEPLFAQDDAAPLVIMTSDHGEALGDHGELTHGLFAYEATLAVPLVLWGPGVPVGRDARPARHIDIFPTVMDVLNFEDMAPDPPSEADGAGHRQRLGQSLLAPPRPSATTYFEALSASLNRGWAPLYGMLRDGHKLIVLPLPELYHLPRDPAETDNLVRRERRRAAELRDGLPPRQLIWPPGGERSDLDSPSAALQSLGYLGGQADVRHDYGPEDDPKNLVELDRTLHQAIDLYSRQQLEAALELTRSIIAARPDMGLGQSLHAQTLLQAGRRDEALAAMQTAHRMGAANPSLVRQLGLTLSQMGRHADALEILRPLAQDGDVKSRQALALALSESGRQDAAHELLAELLQQDPGDAVSHQHLSLVALRREQWSQAADHARRALAHNDALPRAHNNLGVALAQLGETDAAVKAWQRAVDLDPKLYDALYNLGTQALAAGQTEQARNALSRFVETAPEASYRLDLRRARVLLRRLQRAPSP